MKRIDARGQLCPMPLILTRRALRELPEGTPFEVLVDTASAKENLLVDLRERGIEGVAHPEGEGFRVTGLSKRAEPSPAPGDLPPAEAIGSPAPVGRSIGGSEEPSGSPIVVVLRSDRMGEGDEVLGKKLMIGFLQALPDQSRLPTHLLLYNSAARLVAAGSPALEPLQKLEQLGLKISICGSCIDHYGVTSPLLCGVQTDLFRATELQLSAAKLLYP